MKPAIYIEDCKKIPKKAREGLVAAGARTLEDILRFSDIDIANMYGCNGAAVRKIAILMASHGYHWPMRD